MDQKLQSESGVSLIEAMIAMLVLTIGAVGMAATFLHGMRVTTSSPNELIATQKAAEAIESVFSARDSHTITWAELRNQKNGGIFKNAADSVKVAGADGIVNTNDDGNVETVLMPGPDQKMGTADDKIERLTTFTREIAISDIRPDLRLVKVTITYQSGSVKQNYVLTTYISALA
jgi:Tfp pilus assembly protein PilX